MNETLNTIFKRRSIRAFQDAAVPRPYIEQIVSAGHYAASGLNRQPWHFTVCEKQTLLDMIAGEARLEMERAGKTAGTKYEDPDYQNFYHAPTVIFISGKGGQLAKADCANAAQNMCLAATSLGLGSCYIASFMSAMLGPYGETFKKLLEIPEGYDPVFAVAIGYAAGEWPEAPARFMHVNYID